MKYNLFSISLLYLNFLIISLFFTKFTFKFSLLDFLARLNLNSFYLSNGYFFWTNLWYLHIFFFLTIFFYISTKFKFIYNFSMYIIYVFFTTSFVIYFEFLTNNIFSNYLMSHSENINILLKNSVNKIHPFLLYSSFNFFFFWIYIYLTSLNNLLLYSNSILPFLITRVKSSLCFIVIALYLGSWWALQEGSWGGWWNWDSSEFFGLIIMYLLLFFFHSKLPLKTVYISYYFILNSLLYLFIFFLLLQLNFSIISHNFGFRSLKFLNTEVFLFSFLLFFSLTFLKLWNEFTILWSFFFNNKSLILMSSKWVFYQIIYFFNLIVLINLISFFIKTILNFKFMFVFVTFNKLLLSLFLLVYIYSYSLSNLILCFLTIFLFLQNYLFLFLLKSTYKHLFKFYSHYLLFIMFIINLEYKFSILNNHLYINFMEVNNYISYITFNSRDIELFLNFFSNSTTFESKSFDLNILYNYTYQIYLINNFDWHFSVMTIDTLPSILNTLLTVFFICIIFYTFRKKSFI